MNHTKTKQVITVTTHVIELTESEYRLFCGGIGQTSIKSRINAGMTEEQSEFFAKLFDKLD